MIRKKSTLICQVFTPLHSWNVNYGGVFFIDLRVRKMFDARSPIYNSDKSFCILNPSPPFILIGSMKFLPWAIQYLLGWSSDFLVFPLDSAPLLLLLPILSFMSLTSAHIISKFMIMSGIGAVATVIDLILVDRIQLLQFSHRACHSASGLLIRRMPLAYPLTVILLQGYHVQLCTWFILSSLRLQFFSLSFLSELAPSLFSVLVCAFFSFVMIWLEVLIYTK